MSAAAKLFDGRHVVVRVDASPRMGSGHAMRCLTLANALAVQGARVTFVAAELLDSLSERITKAGHRLCAIDTGHAAFATGLDWDREVLPIEVQHRDAEETRRAAGASDLTIVDHYRLDVNWEVAMGSGGMVVIDDLANRRHNCAVLIDQTFGTTGSAYRSLVNQECMLLTGATFALLRPEFFAARSAALRRRRGDAPIERVLVSLGSTDVEGVTCQVMTALVSAGVGCAFDVALSSSAPSLPAVRALAAAEPRIRIHLDSDEMAKLMVRADLSIGAAGTTSWERCCLGLPTITLVLASNQRGVASQLAQAEAATIVTSPVDTAGVVLALRHDPERLRRMSAAAAAIVDGYGTHRVIEALTTAQAPTGRSLTLRRAHAGDSERLWLWRNDPQTRAMAKSSKPIVWADHDRWFAAILIDASTDLLLAEASGKPVAMIRFDDIGGDEALVSINVAPEARGKGVGRDALWTACRRYLADHNNVTLVADIHVSNAASARIFTDMGFATMAVTDGFNRLVLAGQGRQPIQ